MKTVKILAACAALVVATAQTGWSGTTVTPTAQMTVPTILDLSVDTTTIDFGTIAVADFTTGSKTLSGATTLTVKSNGSWTLKVKGNASAWSYTGSETNPNKPVGDLKVKGNAATGWTIDSGFMALNALTTSDATLATGAKTPNAGRAANQDYQVLLNLNNDVAGAYTLTLTYTASNP